MGPVPSASPSRAPYTGPPRGSSPFAPRATGGSAIHHRHRETGIRPPSSGSGAPCRSMPGRWSSSARNRAAGRGWTGGIPETPRDDSGTGFGCTLRHSGEKGAAVANRRRDPVERQRAHTRHQCVPVGPTRRSRLPVLPKRNPSAGAECPARPRGRFSGKCSYVVGSISSQDGQVSVGRYSCHVNARNHRRACEPAAEGR